MARSVNFVVMGRVHRRCGLVRGRLGISWGSISSCKAMDWVRSNLGL